MIAISLWQPWASAIAVGLKKFETRSWAAECVGKRIAIHAAKKNTPELRRWWMHNVKGCGDIVDLNAHTFHLNGIHDWVDLPFGKIVCTADLIAVEKTAQLMSSARISTLECSWGNFSTLDEETGKPRWGWTLSNVEKLAAPVSCVGRQGFFIWNP